MAISFPIPGFRFHPTDIELVMYYLKRKLLGKKIVNAVAEINIYDFSPWDLPGKSNLKSGDLEWFFFCPNLKRYLSGSRCNRATKTGFWKATGKDRKVKYKERMVGSIKTLVFHSLHEGKGKRTDWVMHEYRMDDEQLANAGVVQDMYVLCKVFEKSGAGPKNGAQYGAPYDEKVWNDYESSCSGSQVTVGPDGVTNALDYIQKDSATVNMGVSITKPGSSTVMFSDNERQMDAYSSDDMILEEIASVLGVSTKNNNVNNDNEVYVGVEVGNKERGKSVVPNEGDIYADLVNLIDLDELKAAAEFKDYMTDGTEYTVSKLLSSDDLDMDLRDFYVD